MEWAANIVLRFSMALTSSVFYLEKLFFCWMGKGVGEKSNRKVAVHTPNLQPCLQDLTIRLSHKIANNMECFK